jgi:phosphomannomutase
MYGSGRRVLADLLRDCDWQVAEIRADMNPGFGGIHPEPIDRYLGDLRAALAAAPGAFGLATDGDADRIGAMDEDGVFVDPHKIMALALGHLVTKRKLKGKVVRTVSTTHMLDRMAAEHGLELVETPVGFNYIADHMIANGVLIGGEESGGISFKGNIPEGDGVLMGLLLAEIVATAGKPLNELVAELLAAYGPVFYERNDLRLKRPVDKTQMSQQLAENAPEAIGDHKVAQVATTDGVKYILDDGSWLLIRPSGTEPVLRVYAEGRSPDILKALMDYGVRIANSNGEK